MLAQTSSGTSSVGGTVQDASARVISHAHVVLLDKLHGTRRETFTNDEGGYQFSGLPTGLYSVTVDQAGFRTTTIDNVQVIIDQLANVSATLGVGEVSQSVQVDAQGSTPLLDVASNSLGGVIDNQRVEELPLNGRNFLQLATLIGGTQPSVTTNQTGHDALTISVAGASQWLTGYNINGISTRSPRIGNSSLNISVSAIDQFKIELGFFLPDKGPQVGIVDLLTKAGTNGYHGEIFEYVRNTAFNAHNFFDSLTPGTKDDLHRNQFGFAVGGPASIPGLWNAKNKLWFFGNYEGTRQVDKNVQNQFTPTLANFNGDFSSSTSTFTLYNPFSYDPVTKTRAPFVNNVIPPNLINPVSKSLLAYYIPGASTPLAPGINLTGFPRNTLVDNQFTVRMDAALSQRQSMYVNISYDNSPAVNRDLQPLKGLAFPLKAFLGVIQHTITLGPHVVNVARVGYDRAYTFQTGEGQSGPPIESQIGIPGTLDPHGIPAITLAGSGFTSFGNAYSRVGEIANAYTLNEAMNYTKGTHNLAFGTGIVYHRVKQQNANAGAVGSLTFQPNYTAQLTTSATGAVSFAAKTGNAFADFLLGLPLSGSVAGFQPVHYNFSDYYPYIQDSWRVRPNFTINYGLAWYYSSIPNPQGPDALLPHAFDFTTGLLKYAALKEVSPQVIENDHNNFMPRLGFAWSPGFLSNTTVRAGVGMYYAQLGLNDIQFAVSAPPFSNSFTFSNTATAPLPAISLGNGVFPGVSLPPLTSTFAANLPQGTSFNVFDQFARTPYITQWNFSLQHTFGKNDLVQGDYIGNSGHHGTNRYEANQCPYRADLFCDNSKKPYPRYGAMAYVPYNTNTSYEAMILKYQHQFSKGLTVLANYTFQKALSDGFEPNGPPINTQIASCRSCDKGPVAYNIPHSVVISSVYELPFGKGKAFGNGVGRLGDALIGGWKLSVIGRMNHGTANDVTATNVTSSTNNRQRANRTCNGNDSNIASNVRTNGHVYFDTSCFNQPALGYFGDSGRGILYYPGTDLWDTSFVKGFSIREASKFELRGEFFNVFNHTNFNAPDANVGDKASGKFGIITSAREPRLIQFAGILRF
jgi:hypothetical protein